MAKRVSATILIVLVAMIVLGIILSLATSSAYAQTNGRSVNQTGKTVTPSSTSSSQQASQSIRGAITSSGQFLDNATHKIAGSKSAQTIVNESSDVLGNATVETKKFFSPK